MLRVVAKAAGFDSPIDYCCNEKNRGCALDESCDSKCTLEIENKERFISPDMGFYFKWNLDKSGHPKGCPGFKNKRTGEDLTDDEFRQKGVLIPNCPKQNEDDGFGQELWKTVEDFADNQEFWIETFVNAFEKMISNGYEALDQGPFEFWTHF